MTCSKNGNKDVLKSETKKRKMKRIIYNIAVVVTLTASFLVTTMIILAAALLAVS